MTMTVRGRRRFDALAVLPGVALLLAGLGACGGEISTGEECLPGDFQSTTLADGGKALLQCVLDGSAYAPYDGPDPNVPPDAGPSAPGSDAGDDASAPGACSTLGGAKLGFMCPGCSTSADCQSGLVCFDFPNKTGNICTRNCTPAQQSTLCPPPSEGCGNNGHCKP